MRQRKSHPVRNLDKGDATTDTAEYLATWAKDLVKAAGKREARLVLADYKAIAGNRRLAKEDRVIASERAKALERTL